MTILEFLFGKRKSPADVLRENRQILNRATRELDRETRRLDRQEAVTIAEIRKNVKAGQMEAVRSLAKSLVRNRQYRKKFITTRANIQAISLQLQNFQSQDAMANAMASVTMAMSNMNRQFNLPKFQEVIFEFERQSEMMGLKEDMVDTAVDETVDNGCEEVEANKVVQQVLDELGIEMGEKMSRLPEPDTKNLVENKQKSVQRPIIMSEVDMELQARLDKLKS